MSNEARLTVGLTIRKGNLWYDSNPKAFAADVAGTNGPTPGAILVTTSGVNIPLTELSSLGGLCTLQNLDATNYVDWGIWDGSTYYPLGELLPGEVYPLRLSRSILYGATGTASIHQLRMRANTASCRVVVNAFDK